MTQLLLSEFNSALKSSLTSFSLPENQNFSEFKTHLLSLNLDSDDEISKLNNLL